MKNEIRSSASLYNTIQNTTNAVNEAHFLTQKNQVQEVQVQLIADKKLPTGSFIPAKIQTSLPVYYAHPTTIAAMRPDLFVVGEDFTELSKMLVCFECHQESDEQFWLRCPHCGGTFCPR